VVFLSSDLFNQAQKNDIKTHSAIMKARIVSWFWISSTHAAPAGKEDSFIAKKTRKMTKIYSFQI
jgi:hypothetical protein